MFQEDGHVLYLEKWRTDAPSTCGISAGLKGAGERESGEKTLSGR